MGAERSTPIPGMVDDNMGIISCLLGQDLR